MKATGKKLERYVVEIGGHHIGTFDVKSKWEGFKKLQNNQGQIIAYFGKENMIDGIFKSLTLESDGDEDKAEMTIIQMSESLMPDQEAQPVE